MRRLLDLRRGVRAGALLAAGLTTGLALTTLLTAGPAAARPAPWGSCADYQVVEVRGTGEGQPAGSVLPALASRISNGAERTVLTYGLPYPATADYAASAMAGVEMLAQRLSISAFMCPAQRFVLAGYSQGAWVVGDALAGSGNGAAPAVSASLGAKVAAVVLYCDPRFRAGEAFNTGAFRAGVSGQLPRVKGALTTYSSRIRSYCYTDDNVCQNGAASGAGHTRYAERSTPAAASFVLGRIGAIQPVKR